MKPDATLRETCISHKVCLGYWFLSGSGWIVCGVRGTRLTSLRRVVRQHRHGRRIATCDPFSPRGGLYRASERPELKLAVWRKTRSRHFSSRNPAPAILEGRARSYSSERIAVVSAEAVVSMRNHPAKKNVLAQLVLIKALFRRGSEFARSIDAISRMLAIHTFDNAVEMMLVTIAAHQGKEPRRPSPSVPELLNLVNPALKKQLLDLHQRRNGVHHGGDIPTQNDVIKYEAYAEDFLRTGCEQTSGIAYDHLSLADLVEDEQVKRRIKKVEGALEREAYRDAIAGCDAILIDLFTAAGDMFGKAGQLTRYFAGGEELSRIMTDEYVEQFSDRDWYAFAKDVSKAFVRLGQASTTMQFLDNLRSEFLAFRRLADDINAIGEGELKGSARFSFDLVLKAILKWQAERLF